MKCDLTRKEHVSQRVTYFVELNKCFLDPVELLEPEYTITQNHYSAS